jgi:hypothetical protein
MYSTLNEIYTKIKALNSNPRITKKKERKKEKKRERKKKRTKRKSPPYPHLSLMDTE